MSKMKDTITDEVSDEYRQHKQFHFKYHENCSTCFAENLIIKSNERALSKFNPLSWNNSQTE